MSVGELLLGVAQCLDDMRLCTILFDHLGGAAGASTRLRDVQEHFFDFA